MPYENPPKHTRFKTGQSGNPFGRTPMIQDTELYHLLIMLRQIIDGAMDNLRNKRIQNVDNQ